MNLRLEKVIEAQDSRLLNYCAEYGPEHDSSYLPGIDFAVSDDSPAYLLLREHSSVGAVVLMRSSRYLSVKRGRFSILHSVLGTPQAYSMLLDVIRPHFQGLRSVYLFMPESQISTAQILAQLGFRIERYSFLLRMEALVAPKAKLPHGYSIHQLSRHDRQGLAEFARCLNASFSDLPGHIDSSSDDLAAMFEAATYLDGGIHLLRANGEPAGTICVMRDVENSQAADISAVGVLAAHRGMGLGRALLRHAIAFAVANDLKTMGLSVSATNEAALALYRSEGFVVTDQVACHTLDCGINSAEEV